MAFEIGSFFARLSMNTDGYAKGILSADALTRTFGGTFTSFLVNPVLGGIQALTKLGPAAISMGKDVLASAESVQRLSQQTGITTDTIQAMRAQMDQAGFSASQADQVFSALALRLGEIERNGGEAGEILQSIGVDPSALGSTEQVFRQILDGLQNVSSEQRRSIIIARLFGEEAGQKLANAVGGGSQALDDITAKYRDFGQVTGRENVDSLARLNGELGNMRQLMEGLTQGALSALLEGFELTTEFDEETIRRIGRAISDDIIGPLKQIGEALGTVADQLDRVEKAYTFGKDVINAAVDLYVKQPVEFLYETGGVIVNSPTIARRPIKFTKLYLNNELTLGPVR